MTEMYPGSAGPFDSTENYSLIVARSQRWHRNAILLGRKTRGFGKDKLVLPGGKDKVWLNGISMGFRPATVDAADEFSQETRIDVAGSDMHAAGSLHIVGADGEPSIVRVFTAYFKYRPTFRPSSEFSQMGWYQESNLPYGEMPQDYKYWLPEVLGSKVVHFFAETDGSQMHVRTFSQKVDQQGVPETRFEEPVNEMITLV